jgi:hypothetical protein
MPAVVAPHHVPAAVERVDHAGGALLLSDAGVRRPEHLVLTEEIKQCLLGKPDQAHLQAHLSVRAFL